MPPLNNLVPPAYVNETHDIATARGRPKERRPRRAKSRYRCGIPPPKQPLPLPPHNSTRSRSGEAAAYVNEPHQPPRSSSSCCGSGVDDDGQYDGGWFKLNTASVSGLSGCRSSSAWSARSKEARRVRPLLSELQVSEWQVAGAGSGPTEVEKGVEEHQYSLVLLLLRTGRHTQ
jgi:hypothetical protein